MNTIIYPEHFFSLIPKRWPDRGTMSPSKRSCRVGTLSLPGIIWITVRIYVPDRDVFTNRRPFSVNGVWVVSPAQVLLDCAGLGYAGRDLTQKLVEIYGGL